jgi:hypothetical protein
MSELQRQQQRAREVRERLYGKQKVVNITVKPKLELVCSVPETEPVTPKKPEYLTPDQMIEFMLSMMPSVHVDGGDEYEMAFELIRLTCEKIPYSWPEIISESKSKKYIPYRQYMHVFIYNNFPTLSLNVIGDIFHKDHSTISNSLSRHPEMVIKKNRNYGMVYRNRSNFSTEKRREIIGFVEEKSKEYRVSYAQMQMKFPSGELLTVRNKIIFETIKRFGVKHVYEISSVFSLTPQSLRNSSRSHGKINFLDDARDFLKEAIDGTRYEYEDILGHAKGRNLQSTRKNLMIMVRDKFPFLSFPKIGELFNRHHTSIIYNLKEKKK